MVREVKMLMYICRSFVVDAGSVVADSGIKLCCGTTHILLLAFGASD